MTTFHEEYLTKYFNSLTDEQRTYLLVEFFEELINQEFVDCPTEEDIKENPELVPFWAHTGDPLI